MIDQPEGREARRRKSTFRDTSESRTSPGPCVIQEPGRLSRTQAYAHGGRHTFDSPLSAGFWNLCLISEPAGAPVLEHVLVLEWIGKMDLFPTAETTIGSALMIMGPQSCSDSYPVVCMSVVVLSLTFSL